jgi:hypothetical protein
MLTGPDEMGGAIERVMTGGFSVTSRMRLSCRLNARDQPYDGKGSPLPPPPECVAFVVVTATDSSINLLFVRPVFQVMNEVAMQGNFVRLTTIDCFVDNHHLGRSTVRAPLSLATLYLLFNYYCILTPQFLRRVMACWLPRRRGRPLIPIPAAARPSTHHYR